MARVYSAQLFNSIILGGGGTTTVGGPPAGSIWVLRHLTAYYTPSVTPPLDGFIVALDPLAIVWALGGLGVCVGRTYDWSGRHVVNDGQVVTFTSTDGPNWCLLGSGYELVLP